MSLNNEAFQLKFVCIECIFPKQFLVVLYAATEKVKKRQKQTEKKAGEFNTKSEIGNRIATRRKCAFNGKRLQRRQNWVVLFFLTASLAWPSKAHKNCTLFDWKRKRKQRQHDLAPASTSAASTPPTPACVTPFPPLRFIAFMR